MIRQSPSEIDRAYAPTNWGYVVANAGKAYTADCPTLAAVSTVYGNDYAVLWLTAQVTAVYAMSPNRDEGIVDGINIFCQTFFAEVRYYKLTELMLFFGRYKSGRYDASYSSFDTRRIGVAFREFLKERQVELAKAEREQQSEKARQRKYFVPPEGYTSRQWYEELKRRAAAGDEEAIAALTPPKAE